MQCWAMTCLQSLAKEAAQLTDGHWMFGGDGLTENPFTPTVGSQNRKGPFPRANSLSLERLIFP